LERDDEVPGAFEETVAQELDFEIALALYLGECRGEAPLGQASTDRTK